MCPLPLDDAAFTITLSGVLLRIVENAVSFRPLLDSDFRLGRPSRSILLVPGLSCDPSLVSLSSDGIVGDGIVGSESLSIVGIVGSESHKDGSVGVSV